MSERSITSVAGAARGGAGDAALGGLRVEDLTVRFGSVHAVEGVSIAVAPGEVVALVGPSGCGKSTFLRAVAGLQPSSGRVLWDGVDLSSERVDRRRFGLMFQDHALFAHRDVVSNVGFGLKMKGVGADERRTRVREVLDLVGLAGHGDRSVDTLSGGEAQRVALARALAPGPRLLMLDEPLGSLDRTLRDRLVVDLRRILVATGSAAIHVTHDQEEAYAVADRLVVMRDGRVARDGSVDEVWADPGLEFVARFLGHRNIVSAEVARSLGLSVPDGAAAVVVREAAVRICGQAAGTAPVGVTQLQAVVADVRFRGAISRVELEVETAAGPVALAVHRSRPPRVGEVVGVLIDPNDVALLD